MIICLGTTVEGFPGHVRGRICQALKSVEDDDTQGQVSVCEGACILCTGCSGPGVGRKARDRGYGVEEDARRILKKSRHVGEILCVDEEDSFDDFEENDLNWF